MIPPLAPAQGAGLLLAAAASCYEAAAAFALMFEAGADRSAAPPGAAWPPVTVLKPLCGAEADLYDSLRSFCDQDYPEFQIVFGVADPDDAAIDVVRRLQAEFPARDLRLVVDSHLHGESRKVSNLINMMREARHDHLVLADSDVLVRPQYLSRVVAPLLDPRVGIVTCAYRGRPRPGLWSALGAMFINEWFIPSVRVAALTGSRDFAFGVTIAIRRATLGLIGGFEAIADQLADDFRIGELTRRAGLATVLSDVVVETRVDEPSLRALVRHELRWLRTIRVVRPAGFALSFVTLGVPVAALGAALAPGAPALALLAIAGLARLVICLTARSTASPVTRCLLIPVRDLLSVCLWAASFATRRVHWRDGRYRVARDGSAQLVVRI